jgi:hypothetical protein
MNRLLITVLHNREPEKDRNSMHFNALKKITEPLRYGIANGKRNSFSQ